MANVSRTMEETGGTLRMTTAFRRPLWQVVIFSVILVPVLIFLVFFSLVEALVNLPAAFHAGRAYGAIVVLILLIALTLGVFHLLRRVWPRTERAIIDRRRGQVTVKRPFPLGARTTDIVPSELVGVGYVNSLMGQKRAEILDLLFGWVGWIMGGGGAKRGRKLVLLHRRPDGLESTPLSTVVGFLKDADVALARRVGEFLGTRALVRGTALSVGEMAGILSGREAASHGEMEVEDFSRGTLK